jgi:hypothetical protein
MDPLQFVFAVAAIIALYLVSRALRRRGYGAGGDGGNGGDGNGDGDGGGDGGD